MKERREKVIEGREGKRENGRGRQGKEGGRREKGGRCEEGINILQSILNQKLF